MQENISQMIKRRPIHHKLVGKLTVDTEFGTFSQSGALIVLHQKIWLDLFLIPLYTNGYIDVKRSSPIRIKGSLRRTAINVARHCPRSETFSPTKNDQAIAVTHSNFNRGSIFGARQQFRCSPLNLQALGGPHFRTEAANGRFSSIVSFMITSADGQIVPT